MSDLERFRELILPSISKLQRLASTKLEQELLQINLTLSEFRIVGLLLGEEEGISQKELAKRLGITAASLSVSIHKLEQKAVIERVCDPHDQRINRIRVLPKKDLEHIHQLLGKLEGKAVRGIDAKELMIAKRVLGQIENNMTSTQK